jgi:hypothetical protein
MAKHKRKWAKHRDRKALSMVARNEGPTAEVRARARYVDGHGLMLYVPAWIDWPKEQQRSIKEIAEAYEMIVSGLMPKTMRFGKEEPGREMPWLNSYQEVIAIRYFAWSEEMQRYGMANDRSWVIHCCYDVQAPIRNFEKFQSAIIFHVSLSRSIH